MENVKHNRQAITVEMVEDFMSKYRLATKEDIIALIDESKMKKININSTDTNQEIYITEERREELFNQLLENELLKTKGEYHYEKKYLLSSEYLERICLGKTGLSDSHYTKLIKMLSKEYEEWKENKNKYVS